VPTKTRRSAWRIYRPGFLPTVGCDRARLRSPASLLTSSAEYLMLERGRSAHTRTRRISAHRRRCRLPRDDRPEGPAACRPDNCVAGFFAAPRWLAHKIRDGWRGAPNQRCLARRITSAAKTFTSAVGRCCRDLLAPPIRLPAG